MNKIWDLFLKIRNIFAKYFNKIAGIKNIKRYLAVAGGLFVVMLFMFFGPPGLYSKSAQPDFCNSCHVMNSQHEAWYLTGLHRNIKCVDCHLPNTGTLRHLFWKGVTGGKDLVMFHSGLYSDRIGISSHGKKVVQENCERCHEGMVSVMKTDGRNCWSCHRQVNHTFPMVGVK